MSKILSLTAARIKRAANQRLVLLESVEYPGAVMTQPAYQQWLLTASNEDRATHVIAYIDPSVAADMVSAGLAFGPLTLEDINHAK